MPRIATKKAAGRRKVGKVTQLRNAISQKKTYRNYRDTLLEWSERPAVRYVAGGIGLALIARLTYGLSDRYPEIARFLRENLETVEDKLKEFRGKVNQEQPEARH